MAISVSEWHRSGPTFEHDAQRIFWREGGRDEAPVLLLIHGLPASSWDWEAVWSGLGGYFRLVALDLLGFGFSDKPLRHRYSIGKQADSQQALLRSIGIDDDHALAYDYGDTVAQQLIARDLELRETSSRLRSVCLLNGGLFPETHRLLAIRKLLLSPLGPPVARLSSKSDSIEA